jgi:hypothetical protein
MSVKKKEEKISPLKEKLDFNREVLMTEITELDQSGNDLFKDLEERKNTEENIKKSPVKSPAKSIREKREENQRNSEI